jgi:hypothetical protein
MSKLPILSVAAAATLAACGGYEEVRPVSPAPAAAVVVQPQAVYVAPAVTAPVVTYPSGAVAVVPAQGAVVYESAAVLRPGYGRVTANQQLVYPNGSSAAMIRVTLRMDDGSVQVVDTRGPGIAMGERVEITTDRNIRYPIATR